MVAVPAVGLTRLSTMRSVVVLPAPFGPRKPVTRPGSTTNDKLSTALTLRYCFVRPETTICPLDNVPLPSKTTCQPSIWHVTAIGGAPGTGGHNELSVGDADHVLEARPGVVDRAHLDVDPAVDQGVAPHDVLVEVGRQPRRPLRPGH